MNSFAERVECPIVMTINGIGDVHFFMPNKHPAPMPTREYRLAASFQFRSLAKTFHQHLAIHMVSISRQGFLSTRHVPPQLVEETHALNVT
jgi:hypothetical protein